MIRKAERSKRALRCCLSGPAGSGKTHSALLMAAGLVSDGGKIVVIDTENSVDLEQGKPGIPEFHVCPVSAPFSPASFEKALSECLSEGAEVVIIDTLTQEWEGQGGLLDMKEKAGRDWSAWSKVMPLHNRLVNRMLSFPLHLIVTLRTKTAWELEEYERGGRTLTRPKKFGLKPNQKEGIEYEFDLVFNLDQSTHEADTGKDRTSLFDGKDGFVPSAETGRELRDWLNAGSGETPMETYRKSAEKLEALKAECVCESVQDCVDFWNDHKDEIEKLSPDHRQILIMHLKDMKVRFLSADTLAWAEAEIARMNTGQAFDGWIRQHEQATAKNLTSKDKEIFYQILDEKRKALRKPQPPKPGPDVGDGPERLGV